MRLRWRRDHDRIESAAFEELVERGKRRQTCLLLPRAALAVIAVGATDELNGGQGFQRRHMECTRRPTEPHDPDPHAHLGLDRRVACRATAAGTDAAAVR